MIQDQFRADSRASSVIKNRYEIWYETRLSVARLLHRKSDALVAAAAAGRMVQVVDSKNAERRYNFCRPLVLNLLDMALMPERRLVSRSLEHRKSNHALAMHVRL